MLQRARTILLGRFLVCPEMINFGYRNISKLESISSFLWMSEYLNNFYFSHSFYWFVGDGDSIHLNGIHFNLKNPLVLSKFVICSFEIRWNISCTQTMIYFPIVSKPASFFFAFPFLSVWGGDNKNNWFSFLFSNNVQGWKMQKSY